MTVLLFYFLALFLIGTAASVVLVRNPVYSVFLLIASFIQAAGLYILLGAEYLAMTLIIVYVGAVAVLFLFVVMMLKPTNIAKDLKNSKSLLIFSLLLVCIGINIYLYNQKNTGFNKNQKKPQVIEKYSQEDNDNLVKNHNSREIGLVLYTDYSIQLQLAGIVLLIAMIGSVLITTITSKKDSNIKYKRQSINIQKGRKGNTEATLLDIESGKGIELENGNFKKKDT